MDVPGESILSNYQKFNIVSQIQKFIEEYKIQGASKKKHGLSKKIVSYLLQAAIV